MILLFLFPAVAAAISACTPIDHDHILGRDIAIAVPALKALPAESDFGLAPLPGKTRVLLARELKRIAAEARIPTELTEDVCFTWPTKPLINDVLAAAIKKTLSPRQVDIEIMDQSGWPAPEGEICFPRSGVTFAASGISVWRGYVRFSQTRRFDIWVRARVVVHETHFFTTEKISVGQPLTPVSVKPEKYDGPLTRDDAFIAATQLAGVVARFDIAEGKLLTPALVAIPHAVERGGTLSVIAEVGRARVEAECIAEESGSVGGLITVHNARTGRHLRVVIQSKTRATLVTGDALGLGTGT